MRDRRRTLESIVAILVPMAAVGLTSWAMITCQRAGCRPAALVCAVVLAIEMGLIVQML